VRPSRAPLDNEIGNDRDCFGMIELDAALQAAARDHRGPSKSESLSFSRGRQVHGSTLKTLTFGFSMIFPKTLFFGIML